MFTILDVPSNHAGFDSEAFWLRPVMAITASVQPELGRNRVCRIRLSASVSAPFFQRKCKTDPDPMWMSWSGFGQTHRVRKLVGVQESSGPVSGRTKQARYRFQTRFRSSGTDVPDNIVQNQRGSGLVLADCARFWPNGPGPEASRCARIIRSASGQCFPADPERIRIGYGMFTGVMAENISSVYMIRLCAFCG